MSWHARVGVSRRKYRVRTGRKGERGKERGQGENTSDPPARLYPLWSPLLGFYFYSQSVHRSSSTYLPRHSSSFTNKYKKKNKNKKKERVSLGLLTTSPTAGYGQRLQLSLTLASSSFDGPRAKNLAVHPTRDLHWGSKVFERDVGGLRPTPATVYSLSSAEARDRKDQRESKGYFSRFSLLTQIKKVYIYQVSSKL